MQLLLVMQLLNEMNNQNLQVKLAAGALDPAWCTLFTLMAIFIYASPEPALRQLLQNVASSRAELWKFFLQIHLIHPCSPMAGPFIH